MSGLETLCWKQTFPRHVPVETVRFQPSVSNVGVGNTGLETVVFEFDLEFLAEHGFCMQPDILIGLSPFPTHRFQSLG